MRSLILPLVLLLVLAAMLGCQATTPLDYRQLSDKISNGEPVDVSDLRKMFLARSDLPEQIERLVRVVAQDRGSAGQEAQVGVVGITGLLEQLLGGAHVGGARLRVLLVGLAQLGSDEADDG